MFFNLQSSGSYAAQIEAIVELVLCRRDVKSHTGAGEEIRVKRRDSWQNPRTNTIINDGTRRDKKLSMTKWGCIKKPGMKFTAVWIQQEVTSLWWQAGQLPGRPRWLEQEQQLWGADSRFSQSEGRTKTYMDRWWLLGLYTSTGGHVYWCTKQVGWSGEDLCPQVHDEFYGTLVLVKYTSGVE